MNRVITLLIFFNLYRISRGEIENPFTINIFVNSSIVTDLISGFSM